MTVTVVDRNTEGVEIRKVESDPRWGKSHQFPTSYLLFKDGNRVPGSERHTALGLARVAIGKGVIRQTKKVKSRKKKAKA